jgi:Cytochrome c
LRAPTIFLLILPLAAQTPEERGRQIFEKGTSPSGGAIMASIGRGTPVDGSVLPCVNCHGADGLGRAEGGVVPANITWDALTKPYGVQRPDGRTRPPYTERLAKRAITMGVDPGGADLLRAMPRYQMPQMDATDLLAYLKVLGQSAEPGLTATVARIGVLAPPGRDGLVLRDALSRHFARVNGLGGVFSRRIELVWLDGPADLRSAPVFALCGSFDEGTARTLGLPAIAILAAPPDSPLNPYVFYLDRGAVPASLWDRAVASAEILVEAMKRAGRGLTRASLIQALESFSGVKTSLPGLVTFGPNRRVGIADQK